ncbi:MAG: hypothetical protein H0X62_16120 [Bacteroidetes bacterium]|nr:hypothetical protein [Bacteroidota bacterium]
MKQLAFALLFSVAFISCKKEKPAPEPELVYIETIGKAGTGLGEFNLQKGNIWHGSFAENGTHLFVKDIFNHRIQRLTMDLKPVDWFGYSANTGWGFHKEAVAGEDSIRPQYIYLSGNHLYLTQSHFGNQILKASAQTGLIEKKFSFPMTVSSFAVGLQNEFFVYFNEKNIITKYNDSGDSLFTIGGFGSDSIKFVTADAQIITDKAGNLYVCDSDNKRIQKFNQNGLLIKIWAVNTKKWASIDIYKEKIYVEEEDGFSEYDLNGKLTKSWKLPTEHLLQTRFKVFNTDKVIFEYSYDYNYKVFRLSDGEEE